MSRIHDTRSDSTSAGSMFNSPEIKLILIRVYGFISFISTLKEKKTKFVWTSKVLRCCFHIWKTMRTTPCESSWIQSFMATEIWTAAAYKYFHCCIRRAAIVLEVYHQQTYPTYKSALCVGIKIYICSNSFLLYRKLHKSDIF